MDWARGQMLRGASTITQQLAKNLYLSPSRDPFRKFRELIIARRLEAELTKVRIFELYLNVIEWGDGIYGADAAARRYFGHPATTLGPAEAALLAGAIINPRLLSPAHPTPRLLRRQQIILKRMGGVTPPAQRKWPRASQSSRMRSSRMRPSRSRPNRCRSSICRLHQLTHRPSQNRENPPPSSLTPFRGVRYIQRTRLSTTQSGPRLSHSRAFPQGVLTTCSARTIV
jgi:membrane peptidoglycan carboxypeptidase